MNKNLKILIAIIIGVVLIGAGVIAAIFLFQQVQNSKSDQEKNTNAVKINVVVVTRDLKLGDRIDTADVSVITVPVDAAPRDILSTVDQAVGKFVKTDMVQGEMLLSHNLADPTNNNQDLSFVLSDDHVLMAFQPGDVMTHDSIIQRGDVIDIFATLDETVKNIPGSTVGSQSSTSTSTTTTGATAITGAPEETTTRSFTLDSFQHISVTALVLNVISPESTDAVTGQVTPAKTSVNTYLLALNPQDALILKHLKDGNAQFDLVLRAPTNTKDFNLTPVTDDYIVEYYGLEILP